jgi:hypothetical protein
MVADAEPLPVERQDMVVVVGRSEARVELRRSPRGQLKAVEKAIDVIDEEASVFRPIGRLDRAVRAENGRAPPGFDVEELDRPPI